MKRHSSLLKPEENKRVGWKLILLSIRAAFNISQPNLFLNGQTKGDLHWGLMLSLELKDLGYFFEKRLQERTLYGGHVCISNQQK